MKFLALPDTKQKVKEEKQIYNLTSYSSLLKILKRYCKLRYLLK